MPSLTHDEAIARAGLLTVQSYTVELDLTRGDVTFESVSTVRFTCREPGSASFAELHGRALSVTLNGRQLSLDCPEHRLALSDLAATNELVVRAELDYSHTGEGLHRFVDPADGEAYVYGMSFLDCAQRIYCCFDQPDLKAPLTLSVTVPEGWVVVANEASAFADPVPAEPDSWVDPVTGTVSQADAALEAGASNGRMRWQFRTTRPIATYMSAVCAGPYHSLYRTHDGIRLGWHCRRSLAEHLNADADELFDLTSRCLDAYHTLFEVRYPFGDSYDQVFVPEFNFGAMENPGCVTFRDELLFRSAVTDAERESRASTVAHEMAHMWFGDLVTMRWWDDLWLNESFATYLANRILAEATEFRDAFATFTGRRKLTGYQADQSSWTHPVAPDDVPDTAHALLNFDAISYPKGASVLRQLAAWLGDAFDAGLRAHFERHAYGNATLADLFESLSAASGRDLAHWVDVWLRRSGVNTLVPQVETDADGRYATVRVTQTAPEGVPLRPHRIEVGVYRRTDGQVRRDQRVPATLDPALDEGHTPVPDLAGVPVGDLLLLNDEDLTFATVRLTPDAAGRLTEILPGVPDPMPRALLWGAAWDMTRHAEWPADSFVTLAAAALASEPQVGLTSSMLAFARASVADLYLPPARRDAALD
ncbi:MAG: aminopeptidase N, partial [Actinocatenispora sp.]